MVFKPLVSVIMPVYNAEDFLEQAIQSIIKQTYKNWELIIIDDASVDNSWKIITKFVKDFPEKIHAIRLKKNLNKGGDACANIGIRQAKGKYIARMDADDVAHPRRLEKQVSFLQKYPNIFLVGSQAWVIDRQGNNLGEKNLPLTHDGIYKQFFTFNPLIHPTIMFRKNLIKTKLFYQIKFSANNDLLTFFILLDNKYRFANLKAKLLKYRIHGENDSLSNIKRNFLNSTRIRLTAVKNWGYKPTLISWLKLGLQAIVVLLLPEKILITIYLFSRGILTTKHICGRLKTRLSSSKLIYLKLAKT